MRHYASALCILLLAVGLAGCEEEKAAGTQQQQTAPLVSVMDVRARNVSWPAEYQAIAAGSQAAEVRARVQGIIEKRLYKEGGFVKEGQVLFLLEKDQYEASYEQAQAAFMNAEREWNRIAPLYKANAVSQKDRDQALSSYDSAKAALREAKINLDYCTVVSPVTGFSSKEAQTVGNLVSNNTLLTTVNQTDPMFIDFSISAPDRLQRLALERQGRLKTPEGGVYDARVRLLDGRMYEKTGHVNFVDSQVQPSTGVIKARAVFDNAEGEIMPGQYVRVFMDGDMLVNAVLVPQTAVQFTETGTFVVLVGEGDVAKRIPVKVSVSIGKDYLIDEGLKGGERIVTDGILRTRDGAPVRYEDPNAPAPSDGAAAAGAK